MSVELKKSFIAQRYPWPREEAKTLPAPACVSADSLWIEHVCQIATGLLPIEASIEAVADANLSNPSQALVLHKHNIEATLLILTGPYAGTIGADLGNQSQVKTIGTNFDWQGKEIIQEAKKNGITVATLRPLNTDHIEFSNFDRFRTDIWNLLRERGASVETINDKLLRPLHEVAIPNDYYPIRLLIKILASLPLAVDAETFITNCLEFYNEVASSERYRRYYQTSASD